MSPTGAEALLTPALSGKTWRLALFNPIFCALSCVLEAIPVLWSFLISGWGRPNSEAQDDVFSLPFPPCKSDCSSKQAEEWRTEKRTAGTRILGDAPGIFVAIYRKSFWLPTHS